MFSAQIYDDDTLVSLLKNGNEQAFTLIYRKYWDSMYYASYNRLKDGEQSRDIVQNIFTSLWDRRNSLDIETLSSYLHTAVKFQVLKTVSQKSGSSYFFDTFVELITSPEHTDDKVLETEIRQLLQLFIDALPRKRRIIFLKRYMEDYSTEEIADQLGISRKTVQNQLNNAETAIRARLAQFMSLVVITSFLHHH